MKVKIKLAEGAVLPKYAKPGDAGMDLTAISENIVNKENFGYIEYGTGISLEIPEGYFLDIRPRSSISETGLFLANAPGTIDSQYRGEIKCRFKWIPGTKKYEVGDRVKARKMGLAINQKYGKIVYKDDFIIRVKWDHKDEIDEFDLRDISTSMLIDKI